MTNTSILEYFGMRNSFLTIDLKNNNDINRKFKMAAINLHIGKGKFGILCKYCFHNGTILITLFWVNKIAN